MHGPQGHGKTWHFKVDVITAPINGIHHLQKRRFLRTGLGKVIFYGKQYKTWLATICDENWPFNRSSLCSTDIACEFTA